MSQTDRIRLHLRKHNSITPLVALRRYGCFRLAARIADLRRDGLDVQTVMVSRGKKTFAKYVVA